MTRIVKARCGRCVQEKGRLKPALRRKSGPPKGGPHEVRDLLEQVPEAAPELIVRIRVAAAVEELAPFELEIELVLLGLALPDGEAGLAEPRERADVLVGEIVEAQTAAQVHALREVVDDWHVDETGRARPFLEVAGKA